MELTCKNVLYKVSGLLGVVVPFCILIRQSGPFQLTALLLFSSLKVEHEVSLVCWFLMELVGLPFVFTTELTPLSIMYRVGVRERGKEVKMFCAFKM